MTRVGATILLEVDNGQPVLRPRGYYSASETYVYNSEFRDYVLLDSVDGTGNRITHYFIVRNFGDNIKGVTPVPGDKSSNRRWEESSKIEFIVANSITADMIQAGAITASKIQVAGFNFKNNNIWGGAKFGEGAGIDIVSLNSNRAFRAYKDDTHYVEMFYREDEWGFKGVDGDVNNPIFSLGRKLVGGTWEDQNIVAGWSMTDSGFTSNKFIAPSYDDNGNLISWGSGSKLLSNGGLMISPANNGILPPSTGAMQAARIAAVGDNALILGLEVIAHGNGYLKEITALKLSAKNDYSTPKTTPVALDVEAGNVNIRNGALQIAQGSSISLNGLLYFGNPTISASSTINVGFSSGHFVMISAISGNPVVSVASGLPVGSWFLIGQATKAGGYYYVKLSGNDRFNSRGVAYQEIRSHNQDPTLIFKLSSTVWIVGNLPLNWTEWS